VPVDMSAEEADGWAITDAELTALALSADPDAPLSPDAIPLEMYSDGASTLPQWYMPPVSPRRGRKWLAVVAGLIIASLLVIEAAGLCSTYGPIVLR
jgi:hypothetical protein